MGSRGGSTQANARTLRLDVCCDGTALAVPRVHDAEMLDYPPVPPPSPSGKTTAVLDLARQAPPDVRVLMLTYTAQLKNEARFEFLSP